jgi:hypothetical protein
MFSQNDSIICDSCKKEIKDNNFKCYSYGFSDNESMCDFTDTFKVLSCDNEDCQEQILCKYAYNNIKPLLNSSIRN